MKKIIAIGLLVLVSLSGCTSEKRTTETMAVPTIKLDAIDVYTGEMMTLGPYEPTQGVYLGSYIEKNTLLEGSMANYEAVIGQEQAFRVFQYHGLGDLTPVDLLKCIAKQQTPYIKVLPSQTWDLTPIYELVTDLSVTYDLPLFIELLPVTEQVVDADNYKIYYENAYRVIKKELENAVAVWSIDATRAEEVPVYYPGNHMVDWVGLNVYEPNYKNNEPYTLDIEPKIDFWYKYFQKEKPMMLSTLALSHFSRVDHTYTIQNTKNKLAFYYKELPKDYPRIKAILYADIDMKQIKTDGLEDYRITSDESLAQTLSTLQEAPYYLHAVQEQTLKKVTQPIKYTVEQMMQEDRSYIQGEDLPLSLTQNISKEIPVFYDEKGECYYGLDALKQYEGVEYIKK